MKNRAKHRIFFVDDELNVRTAVSRTLAKVGTEVICFAGAVDCLKQLRCGKCDLLITDVKMPGMDGMELLVKTKRIAPWLPVLVITGYGDIPMAVKALKAGALNFIEKPLNRQSLISVVESALKGAAWPDPVLGEKLTKVEMKVLRLLLKGKKNSEMADMLSRSVRTIEDHRRHIMRKLGAKNLVDLVKRAVMMGLVESSEA